MKNIIIVFIFLFSSVLTAHAALSDQEDKADLAPRSLKEDAFAVSTDETSSADSLNRISGQFDLGFSAPDQTYKSEHHYKPGPMNKAAAEEAAQKNNY